MEVSRTLSDSSQTTVLQCVTSMKYQEHACGASAIVQVKCVILTDSIPLCCNICVFVYVRLTQHICKYIDPIQGYMFRLS
jgi:hypothetical protein